jgi:hypothetical protein
LYFILPLLLLLCGPGAAPCIVAWHGTLCEKSSIVRLFFFPACDYIRTLSKTFNKKWKEHENGMWHATKKQQQFGTMREQTKTARS